MPTTRPGGGPPGRVLPSRRKKSVALVTVETSIAPSKAIRTRGCRLKPSRVLITSMSWQSDGRWAHEGLGSRTRRPVFWLRSCTVKRSDGNGSATTWTPDATAEPDTRNAQQRNSQRARKDGDDMREP